MRSTFGGQCGLKVCSSGSYPEGAGLSVPGIGSSPFRPSALQRAYTRHDGVVAPGALDRRGRNARQAQALPTRQARERPAHFSYHQP